MREKLVSIKISLRYLEKQTVGKGKAMLVLLGRYFRPQLDERLMMNATLAEQHAHVSVVFVPGPGVSYLVYSSNALRW